MTQVQEAVLLHTATYRSIAKVRGFPEISSVQHLEVQRFCVEAYNHAAQQAQLWREFPLARH